MSAAGIAATAVLIGIAIALAIARFRSQLRLGTTAARLEHSQRRLSESLNKLGDLVESFQSRGALITAKVAQQQIVQYHHYPGVIANRDCRYCGRRSLWQRAVTVTENQMIDVSHKPLRVLGNLSRYESTSGVPIHPWDLDYSDWVDDWAQNHPEASMSIYN